MALVGLAAVVALVYALGAVLGPRLFTWVEAVRVNWEWQGRAPVCIDVDPSSPACPRCSTCDYCVCVCVCEDDCPSRDAAGVCRCVP